jgi:outer membrane protein assembly factor BamE (lipoprotein component of BamABCDE complex)
MRFSLKHLLIITGIVAFTIFGLRHCFGPVVPPSTASKIQPGMTHHDVQTILGPPNDGMTDESWAYVRPLNPGWFVVHFDANRNVAYVDHETVF